MPRIANQFFWILYYTAGYHSGPVALPSADGASLCWPRWLRIKIFFVRTWLAAPKMLWIVFTRGRQLLKTFIIINSW